MATAPSEIASLQSYLCGQWHEGHGKKTEVIDPTTGKVCAVFASGELPLKQAYDFAKKEGVPSLAKLTFAERGAILKALSKAIYNSRDTLLDISVASSGTTRSDGKFDLDGASGTLAYYASLGAKLGEKLGDAKTLSEASEQLTQSARFFGQHVWTTRPGMALHINAFNFPAWGMAEKLAVSILAGVPAISKPASSTPYLAYEVAKLFAQVESLPKGAFQFVLGRVDPILDAMGSMDALAFTGSADTGRKLRNHAAFMERSARINVEADSLNSAILCPSISLSDKAFNAFARDVSREITQKAGQKCTATRRIFVPAALLDDAREALVGELSRVRIGDPALDEVRMGPLATAGQKVDFYKGVAALQAAGAEIVFGKTDAPEVLGADATQGAFVGPLLLVAKNPKSALAVHSIEVFGPCATLLPYETIEELVELVSLGDGSLAAAVYGDDREELRQVVNGIAPYHGRVLISSEKVADQTTPPGAVLPSCVHGGPGRAGGGEELGGERGLHFYMQRTALQGDRPWLEKTFPMAKEAAPQEAK